MSSSDCSLIQVEMGANLPYCFHIIDGVVFRFGNVDAEGIGHIISGTDSLLSRQEAINRRSHHQHAVLWPRLEQIAGENEEGLSRFRYPPHQDIIIFQPMLEVREDCRGTVGVPEFIALIACECHMVPMDNVEGRTNEHGEAVNFLPEGVDADGGQLGGVDGLLLHPFEVHDDEHSGRSFPNAFNPSNYHRGAEAHLAFRRCGVARPVGEGGKQYLIYPQ